MTSAFPPSSTPARRRPFPLVGLVLTIIVVVTGTTVATSADAEALSQARTAARIAATNEVGHRVGVGAVGLSLLEVRTATVAELAQAELQRAASALQASAGKATDASRSALQVASDALAASLVDDPTSIDPIFSLREAEKVVTDELSAWQAAEDARLAAEAAAAAQAAADAQAASARAETRTATGARVDPGGSAAPVASPAAPTNADCGPCPGATLVPIVADGVTYWGCP